MDANPVFFPPIVDVNTPEKENREDDVWVRGELPGGVKIRTNKRTGLFERV